MKALLSPGFRSTDKASREHGLQIHLWDRVTIKPGAQTPAERGARAEIAYQVESPVLGHRNTMPDSERKGDRFR
jgi:hypothetical protein